MPTRELTPVLRYLRHVGAGTGEAALSDGQLLERFVRRRDGASFEALLRRHGPMVLGVCRRVLRDAHEAEDAFQATFLLLVRKARWLREPERVGPWLHGVAYRTAVRARSRAARRQACDRHVEDLPAPSTGDNLLWRDLRPVLDDAIDGLPSKYRVPFVLCYLEGMTNAQAAQHLGCPPGTVATRLSRARERLRVRLTRQGLALGGSLVALSLAAQPATAVPPALVADTVRAASAGVIPATVATLMEGVCKAMFMDRMRMLLVALAALAAAGGAGLWTYRALAGEPPARQEEDRQATPPPLVEAAVPPSRPVLAAPPLAVDVGFPAASYRTANFEVTAPTRRCARLVAEAAEQQRRLQGVRWLGKELPDWPEPCRVRVTISAVGVPDPDSEPGGSSTSFQFENGKMVAREMHLEASLERILAKQLPHEVTHTVFAHHFRAPVPRWADEGAAMQAEDEEEQQRHEKSVRQFLRTPGRLIPLRRLFLMADYGKDVAALYAEGYSVTRFLVERKDRRTLVAFVAAGMREGWDTAARTHYGFRGVEELEQAWLGQVRRERAEADRNDPASRFPSGPAPVMAFARVIDGGLVVVRTQTVAYVPVVTSLVRDGTEQKVATYQVQRTETQRAYKAEELRAYGTDGERLGVKAMMRRLRQEVPVLLSADGREVDPLHLQLIKDGTVILVLPVQVGELTPDLARPIGPVAPPPAPAVQRGN
jgi:RNA polymerase sigma factor (sigma-70 family)